MDVSKKIKTIIDKKLVRGCDKTSCSYNVSQQKKSNSVSTSVQDKQQYMHGFACRQGSNDNDYADYFVTNCVAEKGVSLNGMFNSGADGMIGQTLRDPSIGGSYTLTGCRAGQVDPAGYLSPSGSLCLSSTSQ